jgi:Ulp1 family protease
MANPPSSCHLPQGGQLIIAAMGLLPGVSGLYMDSHKGSLLYSKNKYISCMISSVPSEPKQSDCGVHALLSLESEDESDKH